MLRAASSSLGWWSNFLVKYVQRKGERIQLVSCHLRNEHKRLGLAHRFGTGTYRSYDDVLADSANDAVFISTPHSIETEYGTHTAEVKKKQFRGKSAYFSNRKLEESFRCV